MRLMWSWNPRRNRILLTTIIACFLLGGIGYEYVIGFPRLIDGKLVVRRTYWRGKGLGSLLPRGHSSTYYYYTSTESKEVKHGPYRGYHRNGTLASTGEYRHGKHDGAWIDYDQNGAISRQEVWKEGHLLSQISHGPAVVIEREPEK